MRKLILVLWITFVTTPAQGTSLQTLIFKPAGKGPFPAIILLHDCRGLFQNMSVLEIYIQHYLKQGYAVAVPDSFFNRQNIDMCADRSEVPTETQAEDAYQTMNKLIIDNVAILGKVFVVAFSDTQVILDINRLRPQHVEHFVGVIGVNKSPTAASLRRVDNSINKAMDGE